MNKKVIVGMSGGVDSSVAAHLLKEEGYDVAGMTLKMFDPVKVSAGGACGTGDAASDAGRVSEFLGIPHFVDDAQEPFWEKVVCAFANSYECGETPNPCVECNLYIKFGHMLDRAREHGYDHVATGHYAQVVMDEDSGRYLLKKAKDQRKDQTYFLYTLSQEVLARVVFPLGPYTKDEIREIASKVGISAANKPDSQDICFVSDGQYGKFLTEVMGVKNEQGAFLDSEGNEIGKHLGIHNFTIGQRKGLGQTFGKPMFVLEKSEKTRAVVLGSNEELFKSGLIADQVNWILPKPKTGELKVMAKTRYNQKEAPATVFVLEDDKIKVEFEEKQRAIAPGQAVVFYVGDIVAGGGRILSSC